MNRRMRVLLMVGLVASSVAPAVAAPGENLKKAPELKVLHWFNLPKGMEKITLEELRGKIVVLDFWTTWCIPCRRSIPFLIRTEKDFRKKGVVLITISSEPDWKVKPYMKKQRIPYIVGSDAEKTFKEYGVNSIPTIVIIDPDGLIQWRGSSTLVADEMLKRLLKLKPPSEGGSVIDEAEAEAEYKHGERYLKKKKYAKAYKVFRKTSKAFDNTKYGKKAKKKLEEMKADKEIMSAIKDRGMKKRCESWLDTAKVLAKQGDKKGAEKYYRRIIKKYPDSEYAKKAQKELDALLAPEDD